MKTMHLWRVDKKYQMAIKTIVFAKNWTLDVGD